MSDFRNILVGVDLTKHTDAGAATLDVIADNAIARALWVARQSGATLTFFSVLPEGAKSAELFWRLPASLFTAGLAAGAGFVEEPVRHALATLVDQARAQGIACGAVLAHGQVWVEIVREVLRDRHDLLVIGTHDPHGLRRLLLGSTAQKLLHECPCPVWISKPAPGPVPGNILIASDLSPLSDTVVRLGLTLAHLAGAQTHILDVVEFPLDRLRSTGSSHALTQGYHTRIRADAEQGLHAQVERSECPISPPAVTVHVADSDGMPDHAIVKFIHDHHIDLLVLGTTARHGLSGVLLGNMAERLLPEVPCSIMAVKAPDFHCVLQPES